MKSPIVLLGTFCVATLAGLWGSIAGELHGQVKQDKSGEQLYRELCARCHGAKGEGVKTQYSKPLVGDRTVAELSQLIHDTMPEDAPELCVGDDARRVASYMHEAFYSRTAQARHRPPRIELARLTSQQYRLALLDLVATFTPPREALQEPVGLKGEYFKSRRFRREDRVLERIDPQVELSFGESTAVPEQTDTKEFGMRWQGSVLAPETGEYEFVVETQNAARLWLNDERKALIDVWVRSGSDTTFRQSIWLTGGQAYPLRLEFGKLKEPRGSITLQWKRPRHALETIPRRFLFPQTCATSFVLNTPLSPDDRSQGYERGTSISKEWDQATTEGALEVAAYVQTRLAELARTSPNAADRAERLQEFGREWVARAFGRLLTDEELDLFVRKQFAATADPEAAVQRVILVSLKSPRFLFPDSSLPPGPQAIASRLARALGDSLPDRELRAAAATSKLATREEIASHARRLLDDRRTRAKLEAFFRQWLRIDHFDDLAKDPAVFPEFDAARHSDLHTSLELLLDDVLWSESSDFRRLLMTDELFLNGRLAGWYGADLPAEATFQKVKLNEGQRAGVLTHPLLMTGFAYHSTSSPIHRGVFVARSLLGRFLRPPPEAVAPLAPELHADLTTRERITLQTSPAACQACHALINPLGFPLEQFDAIGRFRRDEKTKPVDSQGSYRTRRGELVRFQSARELATFLASSDETHAAFVEQLFQFVTKQPIQAYPAETLPNLLRVFREKNYSVRELLLEIATVAASYHGDKGNTDLR